MSTATMMAKATTERNGGNDGNRCSIHHFYKLEATKPPESDCQGCWAIWRKANER